MRDLAAKNLRFQDANKHEKTRFQDSFKTPPRFRDRNRNFVPSTPLMETMGQTKKRVEKSDEVNSTKKRRKSTSDAIAFLEKKAEQETTLWRGEIEMGEQEETRGFQQTTM